MFTLISEPRRVTAGQRVDLRVQYTHAGDAFGAGAAIRLGYNLADGAGRVQAEAPARPNHLTVSTDAPGVDLQVAPPAGRRSITFYPGAGVSDLYVIDVAVRSGALRAGNRITFVFRDYLVGTSSAGPWELFYHLDPDGRYPLRSHNPDAPHYQEYLTADGREAPPWQSTEVRVAVDPDVAVTTDLALPSLLAPGEAASIRLVAYDRFFNHVPHVRGRVAPVSTLPDGVELPAPEFDTGADGAAQVPVRVTGPVSDGRIRVRTKDLGIAATNPFRVEPDPETRVFWGELHGHSALSDGGRRGPEAFFGYARDVRGLDFAALADHSFGLAVRGHWQRLQHAVDAFTDEAFVPLLGYEILLPVPYGHRNVYFPDTQGLLLMADYQRGSGGSFVGTEPAAWNAVWDPAVLKTPTLEATLAALSGTAFLWTTHHCGKLDPVEHAHLTLYEACSEWGVSEECFRKNRSTTMLPEIFRAGLDVGLTGGSDNHHAQAGFMGRCHGDGAPTPYPSGLTAVLAPCRTRAALYAALKRRHCYATTGARILIRPRVRRESGRLDLNLEVAGTDLLERAWVVKNGETVQDAFLHGGERADVSWTDDTFEPGATCYVRIRQADGELAWINPLPFAGWEDVR